VVAPGLLTTIQDTRLRLQSGRYGVSPGGALDPLAAEIANLLVGNPADVALFEVTVVGPALRALRSTAVAIAGADLSLAIDGRPVQPNSSAFVPAGSLLEFGERHAGARAYLAVAGGLDVPVVLGSRSTDLVGAFGGIDGRPLRFGDTLLAPPVDDAPARAGAVADLPLGLDRPVRIVAGPHLRRLGPGALRQLVETEWRLGASADRMGARLEGTVIRHGRGADVPSLGLPIGAIQVPADGQPIVLLADHQPTGGYAVLACVVRPDVRLFAQRMPGDLVRFELVAVEAARRIEVAMPTIERDDAGWSTARWH
jgi:biotin-dependent carboxylase-like uncharacterized protein